MRNVESHLLEDKMDEAVTHYINTHQTGEPVQVDAYSAFNVQNDTGNRVVTVMHPQNFPSQMCRQVSVGEQVSESGSWDQELLDPEGKLAALVAHLSQNSRTSHHQQPSHHKEPMVRSDVESSVMLDAPMRLFNGQSLEQQIEPIVVQVPHLPPLPPLQEMKRCQETDWFNTKTKNTLKEEARMLEAGGAVLELPPGASPAHTKHPSKKSLPHKKRISKKLKRNNGNSTPHQDIVVINCNEEVQQEEILPDNFVTGVQHQEHLPEDTHHITHEVRPILICQICGEFYGEEQLKFYQHLKQHYEPQTTIIIENPVPDLGIDKMTNTCIVDNVATLPDSIVELSLENTVPKTIYQPMDKHILYTSSDKTLKYTNNKVQYSMASMEKEPAEPDKADLYDTLDKLEMYCCTKCNKSFKKQRQCEAHIKEAHSNSKLEDMGEFSEPEDLMEGIHVTVEAGEEGGETYEQTAETLLPHLTVENGHVHQDHVRHWYLRNGSGGALAPCAGGAYCPVCPACPAPPPPAPAPPPAPTPAPAPPHPAHPAHAPRDQQQHSPQQLKEEVLQRIFEVEVVNTDNANFTDNIIADNGDIQTEQDPPPEEDVKGHLKNDKKKSSKKLECPQCGRVFYHRNSLLYHVLSHNGKQHVCRECGKGFYTSGALKIHKRVHNGDRPYKCEECGRDFRQWSDLKYHKVSKHSNQKQFKCEFCGKEFARKYSLSVHRRIHTGERNYKCEYCTKCFRASSYRLSHMRTHTGDKPYKCTQCEKCFRVAGDLRRHMLTHEKVRNRFEEQKNKTKDTKENKKTSNRSKSIDVKMENESESTEQSNQIGAVKKIATASTTKLPVQKTTPEKKQTQKSTKKSQTVKKGGAPNVTVNQNRISGGQFKMNTEYNVEVFDTRQVNGPFNKFKEVYAEDTVDYTKEQSLHNDPYGKVKDGYGEQIISEFKDSEQRLTEERDFAILRPMFRSNGQLCESVESEKTVFRNRTENTDGKMTVFTHVEKNKEYSGPIVSGSQTLGDMRHLEREVGREVRGDLQGEALENVFFEKLSALYNIPAV